MALSALITPIKAGWLHSLSFMTHHAGGMACGVKNESTDKAVSKNWTWSSTSASKRHNFLPAAPFKYLPVDLSTLDKNLPHAGKYSFSGVCHTLGGHYTKCRLWFRIKREYSHIACAYRARTVCALCRVAE